MIFVMVAFCISLAAALRGRRSHLCPPPWTELRWERKSPRELGRRKGEVSILLFLS